MKRGSSTDSKKDTKMQLHWLRSSWMVVSLLAVVSLSAASDLRLVEAAKKQDKQTARALIKQGVDVNGPQEDGAYSR